MRTKTTLTLAGLAALAVLALGCGGGGNDVEGPGAQGDASSSTAAKGDTGKKDDGKKTIVFEVVGPKSADVTYGVSGDQSQDNGAKLPWKKTVTSGEAFLIPTVVAQSKGQGKITCKISIDGKLVKTNSSSGEFAVVTCTADNI